MSEVLRKNSVKINKHRNKLAERSENSNMEVFKCIRKIFQILLALSQKAEVDEFFIPSWPTSFDFFMGHLMG